METTAMRQSFLLGTIFFDIGLPSAVTYATSGHLLALGLAEILLDEQLLNQGIAMDGHLIEEIGILEGVSGDTVSGLRIHIHEFFQCVFAHHFDGDSLSATHGLNALGGGA